MAPIIRPVRIQEVARQLLTEGSCNLYNWNPMTWTRLIVGERMIARVSPQTQHMREYRVGNDANSFLTFNGACMGPNLGS